MKGFIYEGIHLWRDSFWKGFILEGIHFVLYRIARTPKSFLRIRNAIYILINFLFFIRNVEEIPLWKILLTIIGFSILYMVREFVAESVFVNGKLLSANPTYAIFNLIIHLLFTMIIPYVTLIYTNYMVVKFLKAKSRFLQRQISDNSLETPLFKAKFSTYVVFTFIFCHSFKAIGVQGFYGLYTVSIST